MPRSCTLCIVASVALLLSACYSDAQRSGSPGGPGGRGGPGGPEGREAPIPAVEVVQARLGALPLEERLSGVVRAENQVAIYPEIAAPVVRVAVETGAYVEAGDPLIYLRDTEFREQLQQAEAALLIAKAEAKRTEAVLQELKVRLGRVRELAAKQFQSEQELQALEAQVAAAEAMHQQAEARIVQAQATVDEQREALRRTVVRAPISGYVGERNAEIGMQVDTGTLLFIIGNLDLVQVKIAIADEMIGRIEVGHTALITSENLGDNVIEAKVSRISPFLEPGSYSASAEIDVPNENGLLRPGMFVTVDVLYGESEQATLVPTSALYDDPNTGKLGIYVATSLGTEVPVEVPEVYDPANPPPLSDVTPLAFQEITIVARGRQMVGVEGIQPGDWVVTVGQNLLSNAARSGPAQARVRAIPWERVANLQRLQDQDLLRAFMEKQQRLAREASRTNEASPVDSSLSATRVVGYGL